MDISKNDLIVGALALGVLVWQLPNIQEKQAEQSASVASAKAGMLAQDKMTADQMVLDASAQCAEVRYKKGVEVVSDITMKTAVPIQEGQPVIAGAYAKKYNPAKPNPDFYVGRDVVVGDGYGMTAILRFDPQKGYAVARDICVTPSREQMQLAMKQRPGLQRPGTGQ